MRSCKNGKKGVGYAKSFCKNGKYGKRNVDTVPTSRDILAQPAPVCGEVHFGNNFPNYSFVIDRTPCFANFTSVTSQI